MKLVIRRIGNSLGVILPKSTLAGWKLGEGDTLELGESGIRPGAAGAQAHAVLDELKRRLALEVVARCTPRLIRAKSLANLHRWKKSGVWGPAYEEWRQILGKGDDGELFAAMLGRDDDANRLRQSPPYVGLVPREVVSKLNEEAAR
jgi:antitoxin component of MazEF toxin-antitoxin module